MRNHDLDAGGEARGGVAAANGAAAVVRKPRKRRTRRSWSVEEKVLFVDAGSVNLITVHLKSGKVTILFYDDFEGRRPRTSQSGSKWICRARGSISLTMWANSNNSRSWKTARVSICTDAIDGGRLFVPLLAHLSLAGDCGYGLHGAYNSSVLRGCP